MNIRKDDQVEVVTGDDRGTPSARKVAKVLRVLPAKNKLVVEGVNRVYKHLKPSQRNPQGGRLSKEMPIAVSNALLWCDHCHRGVRVGFRYKASDRNERFCKKCGSGLGELSAPRPTQVQAY